jgi:N-acyl-D-amino-acid deacylase
MFDYLIKGGVVIDGSGRGPVEAHVGLQGDEIVYIGPEERPAKNCIEAGGLVVTPGFIDTHSHSEFTLLADGRAEGKISQGVTTEVNGNCGLSAAPLYGEAYSHREADCEELGIKERWNSFGEYFGLLREKGTAINFATLCGHGNIRASVMGYKDSPPDEKEMAEMKRLLAEAVREGAKGLSTGLIYPPGVYCRTDELTELCTVLESRGIYASHMRSEGDALLESIEEVIAIGAKAKTRVHVSHIKTSGQRNWGKAQGAIDLMERQRASGIAVTCDRYPYIAASTDLDTVLPVWVYEGGAEEELKRLGDTKTAERIKAEIAFRDDAYWKGVYISSTLKPQNRWMEGENVFDIALKLGQRPLDALFTVLIDERVRTGAIFFSMNEENLKKFLSLPYAMIGSDSAVRSFSGTTRTGKPHPRGFGSFARFIGKYVRGEGLMGLPEGIRRMTGLPAETFGLHRRGLLKEGFYADIALFDYQKIADTATFKAPYERAEGIAHVFVNGLPVVKEGEFTGLRPGRVLL